MKITVQQLLNATPSLLALGSAPLPSMMALRVARLLVELDPQARAAEKARQSAYRRHGTEVNGRIDVPAGQLEDLIADLEPMLQTEIEIKAAGLSEQIIESVPSLTAIEIAKLLPLIEAAP